MPLKRLAGIICSYKPCLLAVACLKKNQWLVLNAGCRWTDKLFIRYINACSLKSENCLFPRSSKQKGQQLPCPRRIINRLNQNVQTNRIENETLSDHLPSFLLLKIANARNYELNGLDIVYSKIGSGQ